MPRFVARLLNWYRHNKRALPWRVRGLDSYEVWVSEIMLQQTRVETVIPYFGKWLRLFPTVQALADASEQHVLNAWEGLGYYSRARNFHKAAKILVERYNGELPRDLGELRKLPGVGRYTAGALASIIFGMDEPALDGNLKRVYARLFDISEPVNSPEGEKILWKLAKDNLPKGRAADFNQALMDLGALICVPKNPRCLICPLMKDCKARAKGTQVARPVKKPTKAVPHYIHAAGVIVRWIVNPPHEQVLLTQRPSPGLLGGMWEFPNGRVDQDPAKELAKAIRSGYNLKLRVKRNSNHRAGQKVSESRTRSRGAEALIIVQHAYTHFKVTVHAFMCDLISVSPAENLKWVSLKNLEEYPMGKIDRQIANMLK